MTDIVTRAGKGSDLTYAEIDENWENLNADKAEKPTAGVVAAAGTTQADATAIAADINNLSSSANNQGVRLPAATAGARVVVSNTSGGRNIYVYPASGEKIDVYATDAPFMLAAYALVEVFCAVAGLWQSTIRSAQNPSYFTSTMPANKGGTGASSYAVGDVLYADTTTTLAKLVVGTNGQVLTLADGVPTWAAPSSTFTSAVTAPSYTTPALTATTPTYGSDLLAGIGAFADATGWTLGTGWSITGGQAVYTSGGGTLSATLAVVSGTKYQIDWTHVSGSYNVTFTAGAVSTMAAPYWGNKSLTFIAGTTGSVTLTTSTSAAATIDALTVRQVSTAGRAVAYTALDASGSVAFAPAVTASSLNNTANGRGALNSNTTGYSNQGDGVNSLYSNTTGFYNYGSGLQALYSNTTGFINHGLGFQALYSNTFGSNNYASGFQVLYSNTTGSYNSGDAHQTLYDVTTGSSNTAFGYSTGRGITTGSGNSIFGANVTGLAAGLTNNIILANGTGAIKAQHDGTNWTFTGGVALDKTVTTTGTTGAQTINKVIGSVNFAAAATSLVVTNSLVTANSIIVATVGTVDATMKTAVAVAGAGSFTLTANAAATAETRVNFMVFN